MAQTKREQHGTYVLIGRRELTQDVLTRGPYIYSTSASSHPYIDIPLGASMVAFGHNNLSAGASFAFNVAASASGTYRRVWKADGSGAYSITSGSTAKMVFLADAAPYRFIKPVSNKAFGQKKTFQILLKG